MSHRTPKTSAHSTHRAMTTLRTAGAIIAETLWPTRCAVCDELGAILCENCLHHLPAIDQWQSCQRCGAPWGRYQCTQCNHQRLEAMGLPTFPLRQLVSAVPLTTETHRIVTVFKDQGERRLSNVMATMMAAALPPRWLSDRPTVCAIPATDRAIVKRGFDHAELLASDLAALIGRPYVPLLARPRTRDQRRLGRSERLENMASAFGIRPETAVPKTVIIVDDVTTTGATLIAAALSLLANGAIKVYGITFART